MWLLSRVMHPRLWDSRKAVEETVAAFDKLDIFVGNAGVFDHNQRLDTLDESQLEDAFDELFGVNVKGLVVGAQSCVTRAAQVRRMHDIYSVRCQLQLGWRRSPLHRFPNTR